MHRVMTFVKRGLSEPAVRLLVAALLSPAIIVAVVTSASSLLEGHALYIGTASLAAIALLTGIWTGLLATGVVAAGLWAFFADSTGGLVFQAGSRGLLQLLFFLLISATVVALCGAARSARLALARQVAAARAAGAEANQARDFSERIARSLPDAFLAVDARGRIAYVNDAAERLLGARREDLLGRERAMVFALFSPEVDERYREALVQRRASRFEREDPVSRQVLEAHVYPANEGELSVYFRDVTEHKRALRALEVANERSRRLVTSNIVGIVVGDFEGRVREANDYYLTLVRATRDDLRAGHVRWSQLTAPEHRDVDRLRIEEIRARGISGPHEKQYMRSDGSRVWVLMSSALLSPPGDEYISFVLDITDRKAAGLALQEREEFLRQAQRVAHVGSWQIRLDTMEPIWSEEFYRILGIPPGETLDIEKARSFIHPADRDRWLGITGAEGAAAEYEHRIIRSDGSERIAITRHERLPADGARPERLVGAMVDITELRRVEAALREKEARLRILAEHSHDLLYRLRIKPTFALEYVSPAVSSFAGYTPDELQANPGLLSKLIHPDDPALLERLVRPDFPGGTVEMRLVRKDGTTIWTEGHVSPVHDPSDPTFYAIEGVAHDITARKQAENALREADHRKNEFLAMLAHELRNPLSPIRNSLYVLERTSPAGDQARRAMTVIERQVEHMARLIGDLLDVSRISRGKIQLHRKRLELGTLLRHVYDDHRGLFEANDLSFALELGNEPIWVNADATRVTQAIGNLLNNAAKFTPRGGRVTLQLGRVGEGEALIRVRDTGCGLEPDLVGRVFHPFEQGDQTLAHRSGGLGLGLALVKGLAELHGGQVKAASSGRGKGAEFAIQLPTIPPPTPALGPRRPAPQPAKRRVLVIEDNTDSADSLKEALELCGHEVVVAYAGPDGIKKARIFEPEVVLCDIGLPGMDGYDVARAFRREEALRSAYLVALTGYAAPEDKRRAAEAGFHAHVAKPPSLDELEELLARAHVPAAEGVEAFWTAPEADAR